MFRGLAAGLLVVASALAGCLTGDDPRGTPPPAPLDTVVEQDHDHSDASLHDLEWNLERVSYHTGYGPEAEPAGGFTELAVQLPFVYMCRGGASPGVVVLDVSDPTAPRFMSHFSMPRCDDIEVSADGQWVFAAAQRNHPAELGAGSDGPANLPRGTWVINAADPTELAFESFYPMPYNGPHTILYYQYADGRQIVIHCIYDLYSRLDPTGTIPVAVEGALPVTQRIEIAELGALPDGTMGLTLIGAHQETMQAVMRPQESVIPHDVTVATNPLDGTIYALVAYWDDGVHLLDIDDPTDPQLAGTFHDFAPSGEINIHQVRAFSELMDGRWVLVAEPEIPQAEETGQLTLIDASDPSAMTKLGYWTLPGGLVVNEPFIFSPHNFDLDDEGRIYIGHNHAGVWVIDASDPTMPQTVGALFTTAPNGEVAGGPGAWGCFLRNGLLYVSDGATGLHVLEYVGP